MPVHIPIATRQFSDYTLWPYLTETAGQGAITTESYGNFGLNCMDEIFGKHNVAEYVRSNILCRLETSRMVSDLGFIRSATPPGSTR
jgi:hypothetical protein